MSSLQHTHVWWCSLIPCDDYPKHDTEFSARDLEQLHPKLHLCAPCLYTDLLYGLN